METLVTDIEENHLKTPCRAPCCHCSTFYEKLWDTPKKKN